MSRRIIGYMGGLIALYIVGANASRFGTLFTSGATGGSKVIKTLQGR